jgi:nucleotide-binding universal stress UspA family protein
MFKHVLVPTDGSGLSMDAVRHAISFAKEAGARITFFFATKRIPAFYLGVGTIPDPGVAMQFNDSEEAGAQELLDACVTMATEAGVPSEKLAMVNDLPWQAIIEAAARTGCDLIFMASHGRRGIQAMLLGSETQKVLTHSTIPVLVHR